MNAYPHLFSSFQIGRLWLKNRIVLSPMVTGLAEDGYVTDALSAHYAARARGGVGLAVVEAACVESTLGREGQAQLFIDHPKYLPGLTRLAEAIKSSGAAAFIQLLHLGRQATPDLTGGLPPVAPSAIPDPMIKVMPRALGKGEIDRLVNAFAESAVLAQRAGFDGVELHAAHGYLINQFLSPDANARTDEYGGSLENRSRFLMNITDEIKRRAPGLLLSIRLNIDDFTEGGLAPAESVPVAQALAAHGADVINATCGTPASGLKSIEPASYPEGWRVYLAEAVKQAVPIPVITGGIIRRAAMADQIIRDGKADLVFLGRALLADPAWIVKTREAREDEIRPCINCDLCIGNVSAGKSVTCTVNPYAGRDAAAPYLYGPQTAPAPRHDNKEGSRATWVIGGGPAGLAAALNLSNAGWRVDLFEQEPAPGGRLKAASAPPFKERVGQLKDYYLTLLGRSDVTVHTGAAVTDPAALAGIAANPVPDRIVLATGSRAAALPVPGAERCVSCTEILEGRAPVPQGNVVVIGGGHTGLETALFLAEKGASVTIVEMLPYLAMTMEKKNRRDVINHLEAHGYVKYTNAQVKEITPDAVVLARMDAPDAAPVRIPAGAVVTATGFTPRRELYEACTALAPDVRVIGDARSVRTFADALKEAASL